MSKKSASSNHPNSKIITIYRKESFVDAAQKATAPEFVSMSRKGIGSFWETSTSKTIGSGLNFDEQRLLLPTIVDCEENDRNFRTKVSEYYMALSTQVPYDKGRSLQIGLTESNDEPLSVTNQPLELYDYIAYRHAKAHPHVAGSIKEAEGNMLVQFYIFDAQEAENLKLEENNNKDVALEIYLQVKKEGDVEKIDMMLTLLGTDPRTITGTNAKKLKLEKLKNYAETNSDGFVKMHKSDNFEELYLLQSLANVGFFEKVNQMTINVATGKTIGHTTAQSIAWLKDPANSEEILMLKARLQEALAKPAPATVKAAGARR